MIESMRNKGFVEYELFDSEGNLKERRVVPNTITNAGLAEVASLILADNPDSAVAFDYIALGTDNTPAAATQTALGAEIVSGGGERSAATGTTVTTSVTDDTSQLQVTFTFSASYSIVESGVFNDASAGVMLARQVFTTLNVISGDQLVVTWKIQHS